MDINQFFVWLGGGGCIMAASFVLERITWYTSKSSQAKMWIFFGVASAIGVAAWAVATFVSAAVLAALAPVFLIVAGVFAYVFLGNTFHQSDKLTK
jgi:uncharacterized membrane protein